MDPASVRYTDAKRESNALEGRRTYGDFWVMIIASFNKFFIWSTNGPEVASRTAFPSIYKPNQTQKIRWSYSTNVTVIVP